VIDQGELSLVKVESDKVRVTFYMTKAQLYINGSTEDANIP